MANEFIVPGRIITGSRSLKELNNCIDDIGKKALIVCDQIAVRLGKVKIIGDILSSKKIKFAIFDNFLEEPTDLMVEEAFSIYKKEKCDFFIGIGGGSALDIMKAVAVMDAIGGKLSDQRGKEISGINAKMIAIPTTAGTGSEASQYAIITDTASGVKALFKGKELMPDIVIIDPDLTETLSPKMTASTGISALAHAIEAYTSQKAQPLTDTLALSAIKRIYNYLPLAYRDSGNDVARRELSIAALEAGMAFNNSSATLVHAMTCAIGARFHVPYGIANAMILSGCLEYAKEGARSRFAEMARVIGAAIDNDSEDRAAEFFLLEIKKICDICHMPTFKGYGISREAFFAQIDKMTKDAMESGCASNTRREVDEEVLKDLYRKIYA
ncbi:iron-containing alcohol dehydrogenase [Butyrivibrio sp. YAB3001]|uniref:iron-containing alcohol dehydrogenase n=1 Tax=Butyrivibrio sp. YAB3001 TaxID=1520812 RepID=UPI0008F64199|nr:iron-containing alcohol dehydrogenase [Butyrivibrio sp. YAB3001]SFC31550.1 Alcohol dehydrogenase, class IV [Butyrivibrio sp. YAB3001]